jgi:hypothetical protein
MEEWRHTVPALMMSWYAGSEGGHALADVLLGNVDASGRLPFSIPCDEADLPFFDAEARAITYDRWFGQRLLDKEGKTAAYPLGHGLSYTSFHLSNPRTVAGRCAEWINVIVTVRNVGTRGGRHIIQVYGFDDVEGVRVRCLLGFEPVDLEAGKSRDGCWVILRRFKGFEGRVERLKVVFACHMLSIFVGYVLASRARTSTFVLS